MTSETGQETGAETGDQRASAAYDRAVAGQHRQFPSADGMHEQPPIFGYWSEKYLRAKSKDRVSDVSIDKFFASAIVDAANASGIARVLSVGAGDATQEILIAKQLQLMGREDIEIICADLTPALIADAGVKIAEAGLQGRLTARLVDLNRNFPTEPVGAVMVIDALHHILNLEGLFEQVDNAIGRSGSFIFRDVIGRNGHMRWPEVLESLRALWPRLPERFRQHYIKGTVDLWFENFDCSVEGFEGIRSQDIMPLLADRFDFDQLLTYGGLVDVFVDRIFGWNFDPEQDEDRAFIESLQAAEDSLTASGALKPTQIYAVARRRGEGRQPLLNAQARWAVRDPTAIFPPADLAAAGLKIPYALEPLGRPEVTARAGATLRYAEASPSLASLRWGWQQPEATHVWSYREDSAIALDVQSGVVALVLHTIGYVAPELGPQTITVTANGAVIGQIVHATPYAYAITRLTLPPGTEEVLLRFLPDQSRRPERDGGVDGRAIGFALVSIEPVG